MAGTRTYTVARPTEITISASSDDDSNDEDYSDTAVSRRRRVRPVQQTRVTEMNTDIPVTSRLFEIVILRKHAKLSTCLQRLLLTLSSAERQLAIADILSFICECAGFKHSSITSEVVEAHDVPAKVTGRGARRKSHVNGKESDKRRKERTSIFMDIASPDGFVDSDDSARGLNGSHQTILATPVRTRRNAQAVGASPICDPDNAKAASSSTHDAMNGTDPCETVGFDQEKDLKLTYDNFSWWSFRNMFASLPTDANYSDIVQHCSTPCHSPVSEPDGLFFPKINDLFCDRRSTCISSKFYQLCVERVVPLTTALEAQDGWTIGFGKHNGAYMLFKEFFQQLVLEAEAVSVGELLHALQWICALSMIGFRAVRQFAVIACNDVVSSLLVKLNSLAKNERVFARQLQVEIEMDQRTHERVHGPDSRVTLTVSKSSLELYKKLLLAQRGQKAIMSFLKCLYNVNFASKLQDVLVDIRVAAAFSIGNHVLLNPQIFSSPAYVDFAYRLLPLTDDCTRLLLLRFLCLVERRLGEEEFGILLALHESCVNNCLPDSCEAIEALLLRDVHFNYDRSAVFSHRSEKLFLRLVESLSRNKNSTLGVLIASVFLPSVPIHGFTLVFQVRTDGLRSKYRNMLIPHPAVLGRQTKLVISDESASKVRNFYQCFMELSRLASSIDASEAFVTNLISSLWNHNHLFEDVAGIVRFLCQGGDVASVKARLDGNGQQLLLHITLASFEHLLADATAFTEQQLEVVGTVISYAPVFLRLYRASTSHMKTALQLLEQATSLLQRTGLSLDVSLIKSLSDVVKYLVDNENGCEHTIDSLRLAVRCLYNVYGQSEEAKLHVSSLYRMVSKHLSSESETGMNVLHCAMNLLHYLPLELDVPELLISLIMKNLQSQSADERMIWCTIGYVLFEAELYKCVKTSQPSADGAFGELRDMLLKSIAAVAHNSCSDFTMFVCFHSMASLVQISALAGGLEEVPHEAELEMYRIFLHFLQRVKPSHMRNSMGSLEGAEKGYTIADVYVAGYCESYFVMNPLECVLSMVALFTKVLSARLYCSGLSVLVLLQAISLCPPIAAASGVYLRFLANFDDQILTSLLLFAMIGLYESGARDSASELRHRFVGIVMDNRDKVPVDRKKLNIDSLLLSGMRYALQGPSNWDFITELVELTKTFRSYDGQINSTLLHAQIGALLTPLDVPEELRAKVFEFLQVVGLGGAITIRAMAGCQDIEGIDRCLNIIRRKCSHVDFVSLTGGAVARKERHQPSSTCIVTRQRSVKAVDRLVSSETRATSAGSPESHLDVSPIVVRTFTKSNVRALPPSVGLMRPRSTTSAKIDIDKVSQTVEVEPDVLTESPEFHASTATPMTERSYGMRSTPSFGLLSPSSSLLSPLLFP
ncbi:mitotic cohesin complex, putative [Babesia ovata]|uniref:Mitotic cohesin complex, putative n=1 Tax=Babesia ovata TaxID=189622 RepID=A0A2H6KEX7_9APIC|nr:mitotic cohesin complex, putative [Babesia ovata]GBE61553.1 mitotic cohesin complex, putative [Babesia ovata]